MVPDQVPLISGSGFKKSRMLILVLVSALNQT
jgi:hypothetical protein